MATPKIPNKQYAVSSSRVVSRLLAQLILSATDVDSMWPFHKTLLEIPAILANRPVSRGTDHWRYCVEDKWLCSNSKSDRQENPIMFQPESKNAKQLGAKSSWSVHPLWNH